MLTIILMTISTNDWEVRSWPSEERSYGYNIFAKRCEHIWASVKMGLNHSSSRSNLPTCSYFSSMATVLTIINLKKPGVPQAYEGILSVAKKQRMVDSKACSLKVSSSERCLGHWAQHHFSFISRQYNKLINERASALKTFPLNCNLE